MKERPILFSAPMVRAVLSGQKTQTRRICKPAQAASLSCVIEVPDPLERGQVYNGSHFGNEEGGIHFASPYGGVGDRLWVRECYSGPHILTGSPPRDWNPIAEIWYWADGEPTQGDWTKPKPGMHMPRWASRILLEITAMRVERLQDISEEDAQAEGVEDVTKDVAPSDPEFRFWRRYRDGGPNAYTDNAIASFASLWTEINGPTSWEANPWVWVVEFNRRTS